MNIVHRQLGLETTDALQYPRQRQAGQVVKARRPMFQAPGALVWRFATTVERLAQLTHCNLLLPVLGRTFLQERRKTFLRIGLHAARCHHFAGQPVSLLLHQFDLAVEAMFAKRFGR